VRFGKNALLTRFDEAYVARLEEERGPIVAQEYAKLMIAAERGGPSKVTSSSRGRWTSL